MHDDLGKENDVSEYTLEEVQSKLRTYLNTNLDSLADRRGVSDIISEDKVLLAVMVAMNGSFIMTDQRNKTKKEYGEY